MKPAPAPFVSIGDAASAVLLRMPVADPIGLALAGIGQGVREQAQAASWMHRHRMAGMQINETMIEELRHAARRNAELASFLGQVLRRLKEQEKAS